MGNGDKIPRSADLGSVTGLFSSEPIMEKNGKIYFHRENIDSEISDSLDKIKRFFKRFPRFYRFLVDVISPVYASRRPNRRFRDMSNGTIINIGSGNSTRKNGQVNIDFIDYENVDIVADIHNLPFEDNSLDSVMSVAVLEHVERPEVIIKEIERTLKPGGLVFSSIPFMQPFHASPNDFQRYTLPGIEFLHRDFEIVESGVHGGPVSGFLWVLQDFLSIALSFGSYRLRNLILIFLMLVTWPIKYLDIILQFLPTSEVLASSFYFIGRKK